MKNQDEINSKGSMFPPTSEMKDKIIEYGIDIGTNLLLSIVKEKMFPKKKQELISPNVTMAPQKKPKKKLLSKFLISYILKETIIDRIRAKLSVKPNSRDYSWLIDYPVGRNLIDLAALIKNLDKNETVLDLGSGTGYFAAEVARTLNDSKVFCLDNNLESLKESQKLAELLKINNIEFHRANIEAMPFENEKFDSIFLNMTFGQLIDKISSLSEIYRVLKKGGKLYITEILIDDNYCLPGTVILQANNAGFKAISEKGNLIGYTITFEK